MASSLWEFLGKNVNAIQALSSIVQTIVIVLGFVIFDVFYRLSKDRQIELGDAAAVVKPVFFNYPWREPRIFAAHQYEKSDSDVSGYRHLGQNSRPDQWKKLIKVKKSLLGMKYQIKPLRAGDILTVIISRNGREKNKVILFNKEAL